MVVIDVALTREEVDFCEGVAHRSRSILVESLDLPNADHVTFHGSRTRSKFSFCTKMYAEEVKEWLEIAEAEERQTLQLRVPLDDVSEQILSRRTMSCVY